MAASIFCPALVFLAISCSQSSTQEEKIVDFLNKNEKTFDKNSFELIELVEIDTVTDNERYTVSEILDPGDFNKYEYYEVDTIDSSAALRSISWDIEDYPVLLHRTLTDFDQFSSFHDYNRIQTFFRETRTNSLKSFEREFTANDVFVDSLRSQMAYYGEPFTGCFDSDSLIKYVSLSRAKRKSIFGYLYLLKFRSKNVLKVRRILYDKDMKIIGYAIVS